MKTECIADQLLLQGFHKRDLVVRHDAEVSSSDGGLVLLKQIDERTGITERLAECFTDHRNPSRIMHSLAQLLGQRVYGIALGYEDLNDHDEWRKDALLSIVCGKDDGSFLSGKSTLNRLELGHAAGGDSASRYSKVTWNGEMIERLLVEIYLDHFETAPEEIVLDFDATDDPLHGGQEGRFFHGYYNCYCYLPLYVFAGSFPLLARLRSSNIDGSTGTVEALEMIIPMIRERFPDTRITLRADSGFCREPIMTWCEDHEVSYVLGCAKNNRLKKAIAGEMLAAKQEFERTKEKHKSYKELRYRTRTSWRRTRRVVAKAEHLSKGANPRFIVTNLPKDTWPARELYEGLYCARGDMENRIKEQQLDLFADRTSTAWMSSNQLRLWFSTFAYLFFVLLREGFLAATEWARSQAGTLRTKLLKVAATVRVTTRRILVRLPWAYPYWDAWIQFSRA